jgi:hypothetical protein
LRAEWTELRDASEAYQRQQYTLGLERQKSALEESIKAKEAQLAAGPQPAPGRAMNRPADPVLESLMQQRDALNARLAEARRKPASQKYAEQLARRLEAMQRQIAERQAKFDAGDYSSQSRPAQQNRPLPPELEIAKQQLEAINAKLAEARRGPQLTPEQKSLKALKARLAQSTALYLERLSKHDFSKRKRNEPPTLDAEALKLKADNELAKREYHTGLIHDRMANMTTSQKVFAGAKELLNLPRNIWTSFDLSAVGRQGGWLGLSHPHLAGKAFGPQIKALGSERAAVMAEQEILSRPNAPIYKQAKLYLAPHEALHLSAMEEQIMSRLAGKIPGLRASNRAYITYLNRLRADAMDVFLNYASQKGRNLTQPELEAVANYVNVATGRGDLGRFNAAGEVLSTLLFSPRLMVSRFQLLAGQPFYRGSWFTRRLIAKEYARSLAGVGVMIGLGALVGATVETDPRSSDFGKLKFGNTRVDVLMGLGQVTVFLAKFFSGKSKTPEGKLQPARSGDTLINFARNKANPVVGIGLDIRDIAVGQKPPAGHPQTAGEVARNVVLPLSFGDIYEALQDQGMSRGAALGLLSLLGFGLTTYKSQGERSEVIEAYMKRVRGVTPEQRAAIRKMLEESLKK